MVASASAESTRPLRFIVASPRRGGQLSPGTHGRACVTSLALATLPRALLVADVAGTVSRLAQPDPSHLRRLLSRGRAHRTRRDARAERAGRCGRAVAVGRR